MNKLQASQIIQAYQDYRHWDDYSLYPIPDFDEIDEALDFAIKELWKPDDNEYPLYKVDANGITKVKCDTDIQRDWFSKFISDFNISISDDVVPPFAWTCTKCWDKSAKPEYTLCSKHFDLWEQSKETRLDYKHIVNIDSPKEVREYYNIWDIYENKGQCPKCRDIIESLNHYDYVKCSCWHSFIDGGSDYSRRNSDLINLSVWFNNK